MSEARLVRVGELEIGNDRPLVLISGPCQIESRDHAMECAAALVEICAAAGIGLTVARTDWARIEPPTLRGALISSSPAPSKTPAPEKGLA